MRPFSRTLALFTLLLAAACGGGRQFKTPKTLSEGRLVRPTSMPGAADAALGDEPFRAKPPPDVAAKARPLSTPTEVKLTNGVRVLMLERHDFPSISAVMVLERGSAAGAPGVAALYSEALTSTSDEYKAGEAWQYLLFVGAAAQSNVWHDATTLQVTALTPLFVSALTRTGPMFTAPSFTSDDLDDAKTHLAAARAREGEDPADVAHDALYAQLFPPPHPYGVPISGERARQGARGKNDKTATDRVTKDQVRAFRDAHLCAENVGVAVVGDFKPAAIQQSLERALGKLPRRAPEAAPPFPALAPKSGRKILIIDRPGAAQSSVAIGWPGPRSADPQLVPLEVLAAATGGDLSTRLNITVRKELGASYGVHMHVTGLREAGSIRITAAIETSRTVEAMRGIFTQLERLRKEPVSAEELAAAKQRAYYDFERGSTRGIARYLARSLSEGLAPAYVVTHNARVDVVTAESLRAAAERWITPDEVHVVVVGDASKIAAGLRALELGDVSPAEPPGP